MQIEKKSRSIHFLLELLISLVFFAFSMIVCVQLFVKADQQNDYATELNRALLKSENIAEQLKNIAPEEINILNGQWQGNVYELYFDENNQQVNEKSDLTIRISIEEDKVNLYKIVALRAHDEEVLYELSSVNYENEVQNDE